MNSYTVLFENSDFIVVDKASGVLSVPSRIGEKETRPVLGKILETDFKTRIFPIHRLDAEVSGILLFARNPNAHREANQVFEKHWVQKTYEALSLASGEFSSASAHFEWRSKILRGKKRAYESPVGKDSITRARIKSKLEWQGHPALLWELEPITGRSHQLRFEMARHKVPIFGDTLYGSTITLPNGGIALRAVKIDFSTAHEKNLIKTLPPLIEAKNLVAFLK